MLRCQLADRLKCSASLAFDLLVCLNLQVSNASRLGRRLLQRHVEWISDRRSNVEGVEVKEVAAEQGYLGSRWTLNKVPSGKKLEIRTTFCNGGAAVPDSWECGREDESRDGILLTAGWDVHHLKLRDIRGRHRQRSEPVVVRNRKHVYVFVVSVSQSLHAIVSEDTIEVPETWHN